MASFYSVLACHAVESVKTASMENVSDQHTGGQWLIHDTKRPKDNQLQRLKLPLDYPNWVSICDIKESHGTMLNPTFWKKVHGKKNILRGGRLQNAKYLVSKYCLK